MTTAELPASVIGSEQRPLPQPDPMTEFFWEGARNHRLLILRCEHCGRYNHWPRPICRFCHAETLVPSEVSGRGTIWSYTVVCYSYHPGMKPPYVLAAIELDEQPGLRMVSNVIDCGEDELAVGLPVEVVFQDVAPEVTLPLFRLVRPAS
jgi:uncharacterized protein